MRFQPPPGYQTIYNPIIPYVGPIYGGLRLGMTLCFQGTVSNNCNRFAINLQDGLAKNSDIAFHFNPRLKDWELTMNSKEGGNWNSDRIRIFSPLLIHRGENFQLLFIVTSEGYQVKVNGSDYILFKHRMPLERMCGLSINGDVSVHIINIIGGGIGHIPGYPGLGQMVGIPFTMPIYGGLRPAMSLHIQGAIPYDVTRFHISLQSAETKCSDKALYINPRFNPKEVVVFNTFKNMKFEEQERATDMPFTVGESFELVITVTRQGYQVNVNGREFYMFKHRMPSTRMLALGIGGDVFVQSINVMGGGHGAIRAWPGPGYIGDKPHTQLIPGGLEVGMSLYLRGTIPSEDISSFQVNLEGGDSTAVQFNPLFRGWIGVVFNTRDNGEWQAEERVDEMPFRKGQSFELVLFVTSEGYQVIIDGREFHIYKHRLPLEQVTHVVIHGEVSVATINIIRKMDEQQIYAGPGDVSSTDYSLTFDSGLKPGMSLNFDGTFHREVQSFFINLMASDDIAMHFIVYFIFNKVVLNTCNKGTWGQEEYITPLPFSEGMDFLLFFNITSEGYQVIVNNSVIHTYKHRIPMDHLTSLLISGDVSVQSITINADLEVIPESPEDEQGHVQLYPGPGDVSGIKYTLAIDGSLRPGMSLIIEGRVSQDAPETLFFINLMAGDDIAMHFIVYFKHSKVVINTCNKGAWGKEEEITPLPFSKGKDFLLFFNITSEGYQMTVNISEIYTFKHRMPVDHVTSLLISGDVSVQSIAIIAEQRHIQAYPGPGDVSNTPFTQAIDGGLKRGMSLYVQGTVHSEIDWFVINLDAGKDVAMHFRVYMKYADLLVFNTFLNNGWKIEEKLDQMPFTKGQDFDLLIIATLKGYQVIVNGCKIHMYEHRIQMDCVTSLTVDGDFSIKSIAIIKGSSGGEEEGGSWYNWRFLPTMKQPIYNPPVPYTMMIPGGLTQKRTIALNGRVPPDANRFSFNFYVSTSGDCALHMNPRLNDKVLVRNALLRGKWGKEEKYIKFNPFQKGQHFEILIRCGTEKLKFFGNGKHMFDFYHRFQPFTKIDTLEIKGDLHLSHILM